MNTSVSLSVQRCGVNRLAWELGRTLAIVSLVLWAVVLGVGATTIRVPGDFRFLQEAINAAQDGDEIILRAAKYCSGGSASLTGVGGPYEHWFPRDLSRTWGSLEIDKSLHIRGSGLDETILLSTSTPARILIGSASQVVFENLSIVGSWGRGNDPEIVVSDTATAVFRNVRFVNPVLIVEDNAKSELMSCTFTDTHNSGGIVTRDQAAIYLKDCSFDKSGTCLNIGEGSTLIAEDCEFVSGIDASLCMGIGGFAELRRCVVRTEHAYGTCISGSALLDDCSLYGGSKGISAGQYIELRESSVSCSAEDAVAILVGQEAVIIGCEISRSSIGIRISQNLAKAEIRDTSFLNMTTTAILLQGGDTLVDSCEVIGAGESGILLEEEARALISNSIIRDGAGWGVLSRDSAIAVGWGNTIRDNQRNLAGVSEWLVRPQLPANQPEVLVPAQVPDIEEAIYRVAAGGTVIVESGDYSGARIGIFKPLTLEGRGQEATIGGVSLFRDLVEVRISGVSILGNDGGIGVFVAPGTYLDLQRSRISAWSTGLELLSGSTALLQDCTVTMNRIGIADSSSALQVKRCNISSNEVAVSSSSAELTVEECTVTDNRSGRSYERPAISLGGGHASIKDSTIDRNEAGISASGETCSISNCSISYNDTWAVDTQCAMLIDDCSIAANTYGIIIYSGDISLSRTVISGNEYGVYLDERGQYVQRLDGQDLCIQGNTSKDLDPSIDQYPWPRAFEECNFSVDSEPPLIVEDLAIGRDGEEEAAPVLTWTNPPDSDLAQVRVCRKAGSWPTDHTDGEVVLDERSPVRGIEIEYSDQAQALGDTYYYVVFAADLNGNWNDSVQEGFNARSVTVGSFRPDQPPLCTLRLLDKRTVKQATEFDVGQWFGISLEGSEDDQGIEAVRFCSDEAKDGQPTGDWTDWYAWATSDGDWDSATKAKGWSCSTPGQKEIWVEVVDADGNLAQCSASVFVHPGYAVIVAGQGGWPDKRGIDHAANNAYRALRNLGFDDDHVVYLNSATPQDVDNDNDDEVDGNASLNAFKDAIHKVAQAVKDSSTPVLIYLVGHGEQDCFIFDENDSASAYLWVSEIPGTPGLAELLSEFTEPVPCAVVVGSCYSGCFIASSEASPGSISAPDRVVITFSHDDEDRKMVGLVRSSDTLWADLMDGADLRTAFENRSLPGDTSNLWLDDNGDHIGHPPHRLEDDGDVASRFRIGVPGSDDLKLKSWVFFWLRSPGELRVHDGDGRITGVVNGEVTEEIPDSLFDAQNNIVAMFGPPESYHCEVVGTGEGSYDLDCVYVAAGKDYAVAAVEVPTLRGAVHRYTVDWNVIAQGGEGMTLQVDAQGDGEFEETHQAGQRFSGAALEPTSPVASGSQGRAFPVWLIGVGVAVLVLVAILFGYLRRRPRMQS